MKQTALVLEHTRNLSIREIEIGETLGPRDVRVDIHTVGVCGSDVHYYQHGAIGPFVVNAPMILGHEAAGTVTQIGPEVTHLKVGDRVCMEPGIPDADSPPHPTWHVQSGPSGSILGDAAPCMVACVHP